MRKLWGVGILLLSHLTSVVSLLPLLWSILGEVIFPYWKFNLDIDFILPPDFPCWCPNVRCARSWIFCILYLPRWCSNVWYAGWHFCILYFCIFVFCIFLVDVQIFGIQAGTFLLIPPHSLSLDIRSYDIVDIMIMIFIESKTHKN